jgi:hypothetical protein
MATTVNEYKNDAQNGRNFDADDWNKIANGAELHQVNLCELFGPGVIGATDWNLAIVAGQIALTITAGQGIVGDAGERAVRATTATVTIDADQGLGASNTYYVFKKRDLTDTADDATGFVAQLSAVAPADSILIGSAVLNATEATSVDNLPTGRINLRNPVVLSGLAADKPPFGTVGRFYFETDTSGGTLWYDTGAAWQQVGPGTSETHVLATATAIGPRHSVSGLTAGQILTAISATDVAFKNVILAAIAIDTAGAAPGASALLHLRSTTKGAIAAPVMTTAQADAISSPAVGVQVYDSDVTALRAFGVRWSYRSGALFAGIADATLGNSTTETSIVPATGVGTMNLNFGYLAVGKSLRITGSGHISETGTPTLRIRLKCNTTVILDTTAYTLPASLSSSRLHFEFLVTCRTAGAGGTVQCQGYVITGGTRTEIIKTATVTVNTTSNHTVDVTGQWGTADALNTLTVTNLYMEAIP